MLPMVRCALGNSFDKLSPSNIKYSMQQACTTDNLLVPLPIRNQEQYWGCVYSFTYIKFHIQYYLQYQINKEGKNKLEKKSCFFILHSMVMCTTGSKLNGLSWFEQQCTEMAIRPVVPKAAWPMSGYVSRPSLLSRQWRRSTPVYHASRANKKSITSPSHPPCLMA